MSRRTVSALGSDYYLGSRSRLSLDRYSGERVIPIAIAFGFAGYVERLDMLTPPNNCNSASHKSLVM